MIPVFSASKLLHKAVDLANETMFCPEECVKDEMGHYNRPSDREQCICMAEDILVPTFGRRLFAHAMYDGAMDSASEIVAVESIGGEEWEEFKHLARGHVLEIWNIRSRREQPGIDIRQLMTEGQDLWNDDTIEEWQEYIGNRVRSICLAHMARSVRFAH